MLQSLIIQLDQTGLFIFSITGAHWFERRIEDPFGKEAEEKKIRPQEFFPTIPVEE